VRGTWREGSHTEDSERWISKGSGKRAFPFAGTPQREPKRIKEGRAWPAWLLGRNLYVDIFFCYV
jgi:hypothetical protein